MRNNTLQTAINNAKEMINWNSLKDFIVDYAYSEIGERRDGSATMLIDEIGTTCKMIAKADVKVVNYYYSRNAFYNAELTAEEKAERAERSYENGIKKIFWLNSVCRQYVGTGFLQQKIDKSDTAAVRKMVDAFTFAIHHHDLME